MEYQTAIYSADRQPFQAHRESSDQERQHNQRETNRFHEVVSRSTEPLPNFNCYVLN
jgi:predicted glutamine amidotransferase